MSSQNGRTKFSEFDDLKVTLRRFVEEVCEALSNIEFPRRRWVHIDRREDGSTAFPEEERLDVSGIIWQIQHKLHTQSSESLNQVMELVRSEPKLANKFLVDAGGKAIHAKKMQYWWGTNIFAGRFLHAYFTQRQGPEFDEETFTLVFQGMIQDLVSSEITVTELSPLLNVQLDTGEIEVAPGLVLRKLSLNELEEWLNEYLSMPLAMVHSPLTVDPTNLDCAIEATYRQGRNEASGARREFPKMASSLVTTLRLLSDQSVYIAFTKHKSESMLRFGGGTSSSLRPRKLGTKARIDSSMQQDIIDTWNQINDLPSDSAISLALRRWDIMFERFNDDDALIDYWIALESLFAPESSQEVRYRSSLRIADFVGETPEEREQIYGEMRKSYELRSKIVHGGVPDTRQKSDLIAKTRSYLRRSLIKVLPSCAQFHPELIETELLRK